MSKFIKLTKRSYSDEYPRREAGAAHLCRSGNTVTRWNWSCVRVSAWARSVIVLFPSFIFTPKQVEKQPWTVVVHFWYYAYAEVFRCNSQKCTIPGKRDLPAGDVSFSNVLSTTVLHYKRQAIPQLLARQCIPEAPACGTTNNLQSSSLQQHRRLGSGQWFPCRDISGIFDLRSPAKGTKAHKKLRILFF